MSDKKLSRIINRSLFNGIFNALFLSRNVFMKKDGETLPVRFLKYDEGISTIEIPPGHDPFAQVVVFVERTNDIVYSNMNYRGTAGGNKYLFDTVDIQVIESVHSDVKKEVSNNRAVNRIGQAYVSSIVSDFSLESSLKNSSRKVEFLRGEITGKVRNRFESVETVFIHDSKLNVRMNYFKQTSRPYFIPEIRKPVNNDEEDLVMYMNTIYAKDYSVSKNRYHSEICVPLLYRMMLPCGYIQINSKETLTDKDYSAIRKLGMSASTIMSNSTSLIKGTDEIMPTADVSSKGLSVIFKNKPLIRHFRDKSSIIFDLTLPDNKKATALSVVRNITLSSCGVYRVGCEIANIDPIGEANYDEFISSITVQ